MAIKRALSTSSFLLGDLNLIEAIGMSPTFMMKFKLSTSEKLKLVERRPVNTICPSCHSSVVTKVKTEPNVITHIIAGIFCF
ncbi:hypothetical protein Bhyg_07424, partial [Pseudolycoriella hygida]